MTVVLAGTFAGRGGIQTHLHWLSHALLESGHRVRIISLGNSLSEGDQERADLLKTLGDFDVICPQTTRNGTTHGTLRTAIRVTQELRRLLPDVFVACGTGWNLFLPAIIGGACPHRIFHEVMSGESNGRWDSRRAIRRGFHEVVAQASPVGKTFEKEFGWKGVIPVLPAFPEPLEITAVLPKVISRRVEPGKIKAAFFSRLVPHKGALWLVEQWPKLARWIDELHIYGNGPDKQPIEDLITCKQWHGHVFCHGPYPDGQEYADLLASFDVTLLPTLGAEGAPLVLLESMACGVPFVAYGVGGIPDYHNSDCKIVDPDSPTSFLKGIEVLAESLANGSLDQSRLQKFYLNTFSYQKLSRLWVNHLEASFTPQ